MQRQLQGFSDFELREMAAYFSQQPARFSKQRVDWGLVSKGQKLHRHYCRDCHGDHQQEADWNTPKLNGQWMDYLRWTLQDYLLGANQAEEEMSQALIRVIRYHGEEGVEALVHYYGSTRPDATRVR
jgi:sulfide dehydrogenase cytochrome subunit